jgi:hypothetical protein
MPDNKTSWVTIGSIGAGFLMIFCCLCGAGGYIVGKGILLGGAQRAEKEKAERQQMLNDLRSVATGVMRHTDATKRGPANVDELAPHAEDPPAIDRVRKGEIQVIWNASRKEDQPSGSNALVAWATQPANNGNRLVVNLDCIAKEVSEAEFQTMAKAKVQSEQGDRRDDLLAIGKACFNYHIVSDQLPASAEEIQGMLVGNPQQALDRLRKGEIEIIWNAGRPTDYANEGTSKVMLGWDTKALASGNRLVLFMDGSVREISTAEFQTTTKARSKSK